MGSTSASFIGTCPEFQENDLLAMEELEKDVTYRTFIEHVPVSLLKSLFPFYNWEPGRRKPAHCWSMRLKDDWRAASFHKSVFRGKSVYYVTHSQIHYIFAFE